VLARIERECRVLLTFDKDFGELARSARLPLTSGVVLFRILVPRPPDVGRRLADPVTARDDWVGHFSIIEPRRVRMRAARAVTRTASRGEVGFGGTYP
jgi:hypothetical protein